MTIPILIVHFGAAEYVLHTLRMSACTNRCIWLISDSASIAFYKQHLQKSIARYIVVNPREFDVSTYIHASPNSYGLEKLCIVRWKILDHVMHMHSVPRAFICDSDVILLVDVQPILKHPRFTTDDVYLCTSASKNVTGGQSVWSHTKLHEFCEFVDRFYIDNRAAITSWYSASDKTGGVCDMTLLYYFVHGHTKFIGLRIPTYPLYTHDLCNIFKHDDEVWTFDLHVGAPGNHVYPKAYPLERGEHMKTLTKKFLFQGKDSHGYSVYARHSNLNANVRFVLLHFQGPHKRDIHTVCTKLLKS